MHFQVHPHPHPRHSKYMCEFGLIMGTCRPKIPLTNNVIIRLLSTLHGPVHAKKCSIYCSGSAEHLLSTPLST